MGINLNTEMTALQDKYVNYLVIRHMTTNKCNCWREVSNSADPECPRCEGHGWLFEEWVQRCKFFYESSYRPVAHLHQFDYGETYNNLLTVYLESNTRSRKLNNNDYVYEVRCLADGRVITPLQRIRRWQVTDIFDLQLNHNKSEFIKLFAKPQIV